DGHVADGTPDRLGEIEVRIPEAPAHRERDVDVALRVLHERDDHAQWQAEVALGSVIRARPGDLEPAQANVGLGIQNVALHPAAEPRAEPAIPRLPRDLTQPVRVRVRHGEAPEVAAHVEPEWSAQGATRSADRQERTGTRPSRELELRRLSCPSRR